MEITYTIHSYFEHCSVCFNSEKYSYNKLKEIQKKRGNDYIKKKKIKSKPYSNLINEDSEEFKKSNLSLEELKEFQYLKQKSKAKSWLSSQRTLRKKGKLKQNQIDRLNHLGMLWNPNIDEWEINYDNYRKEILVDVILKMKFKEYGLSDSKLNDLKNQEVWIKKQRELFYKGKLEEENLKRLKAIDFPFEPTLDENHKITLYQLVRLVYRIKTLKEELVSSRKIFVNFYNLPIENKNIGSKVEITEVIVDKKREDRKQLELKRYEKILKENEVSEQIAKVNAIEFLNSKSTEYFVEQIDRYGKQKPLTWNEKQNFKEAEKNLESLSSYQIDLYYSAYTSLSSFLTNSYSYQSKIKGIYYSTYIKYEFCDEVKCYASEKMLNILNEKLLVTGRFNKTKSFKPITFLLKYYKSNNLLVELVRLDKIIQRHQILSLIYANRIKKVWKSLN